MSPSTILERWRQEARRFPKRIVLADAGDPRAAEAAAVLNGDGLAHATVIEEPAEHVSVAVAELADRLAKPVDLDDPLHVGALLVATGEADGCIGGASRTTAHVIRAGLRVLGVAPGVSVVSSCFILVLPDGRPVAYGDGAVLPDPDVEELASVAVSCAETFHRLCNEEPRVAMLSFSTKGCADHPRVDKVRAATALARTMAPDVAIDGELQFDAALLEAVAEVKAPGSPVAGRANVFVFPDLDSANIGYKITERLAGAKAFGPLLQGLGGVMHDLSRGCSVDDIVTVSVIAAIQAGGRDPQPSSSITA